MEENKTVCQEGDEIVGGDRRKAYGPVSVSLKRIAKIWSAILDKEVTPPQVALCLTGLKIARECHSHKRDNLVDFCGYSRVLELFYEEEPPPEQTLQQARQMAEELANKKCIESVIPPQILKACLDG